MSDDSLSVIEKIHLNAEIVMQFLRDNQVPAEYSLKALEWLEQHLDQNRARYLNNNPGNIISIFGSFLGECMCRNYQGQWTLTEYGWGVKIGENEMTAFPFNKMEKFLYGDSSDAFTPFYGSIPAIIQHNRQKRQ